MYGLECILLTLKVLNFCSLKPVCSGMGEVVPACMVPRRPYIPHPLPLCINCRD